MVFFPSLPGRSPKVRCCLDGATARIQVVNSKTSRAYDALRHDSMCAELVAFDAEWVPDFKGSNHPISAPGQEMGGWEVESWGPRKRSSDIRMWSEFLLETGWRWDDGMESNGWMDMG